MRSEVEKRINRLPFYVRDLAWGLWNEKVMWNLARQLHKENLGLERTDEFLNKAAPGGGENTKQALPNAGRGEN